MKRLKSFLSIGESTNPSGKRRLILSWKVWTIFALVVFLFYYIALPGKLFNDPFSTVLLDRNQELLSASIADDGQWRFPEGIAVPEKFAEAIILFEDKRFQSHWGVDPRSFARAIQQNIEAGDVVSGGSTITMQVIRLSRKGRNRSVYEKMIEMILASRLEFRYTKEEILALYAAHAPFGGNVVGLEAACWRYFGRDPSQLSWGEAALLAVLPNAPSLLHPGKNRDLLREKRNRLLIKLRDAGKIDAFTCSLAMDEVIPEEPKPLPRLARHLLDRAVKEGNGGKKIVTTLQLDLQVRVEQILGDHHQRLKGNHVFNGAALVAEVNTGNVLAYVGNTSTENDAAFSGSVDCIQAPRSTGSILKPFLFAAMLDEGKTLPKTLWPDIPLQINGFTPKNFSKEFDGAVPADKALIRSLNVPAVNMLRTYRYEKFHSLLEQMGMSTLRFEPDHYGLSLILGGAEGTLWDITGMYGSSARILNRYFERKGKNRYSPADIHALNFHASTEDSVPLKEDHEFDATSWLSAAAIYQTFDVLKEVYRPGEESGWRNFYSSKKIAWKTGTSFGHRDAWAVGVTPDYVVGVWIGNADGEGRPGLTGTDAAAPLMLDVFSQLQGQHWFQEPYNELEQITVCKKSGFRSTTRCEELDTLWVATKGLLSQSCPFHKKIHLTTDKKFRVHSDCDRVSKMVSTNWFVLPPVQEYYYKSKNLYYKSLPPFRKDCQPSQGIGAMDLIYPKHDARIYVPRELDGKPGQAVFELAHRDPGTIVFWHLDGDYIGSTQKHHFLPLNPSEGPHTLTLVDASGEYLERRFEVLSKR
jgi:penicillin-binding protein 1C